MKSIVEEASSIMKAIEKCWQRADKPQEFSIKILEKPEKNFFGFTTKPAKVVLFYNNYASASLPHGQRSDTHDSQPRYRKPYRKYYNNQGHNQGRHRSYEKHAAHQKESSRKDGPSGHSGDAQRLNNHGHNKDRSSSS